MPLLGSFGAFRRCLDAVGSGELHLTGLLMLGPHLTTTNIVEVLARSKHRTKREIAKLVRVLDPLPAVPARIEALGPAPARLVPPEPSWEQFVGAMSPVRELAAGERPREWGSELDTDDGGTLVTGRAAEPSDDADGAAPARVAADAAASVRVDTDATASARVDDEVPALARVAAEAFGRLAPFQYKVQFTATEEYVHLVEEAKALLSHAHPRVTLEEVQLRAMRAFVEALRKRKYGSKEAAVGTTGESAPPGVTKDGGAPLGIAAGSAPDTSSSPPPPSQSEPRRRGRHVPLAVRREVAARDGHRCTYVDASGRRCLETGRLEFHHLVPFAVSASHDTSNLTLRCLAHNALAAEEDFGRELVDHRRNAARHASFSERGDALRNAGRPA